MKEISSNQKDELYYSDLIYKIKKLAGIEVSFDEETEKRINKREQSTQTIINGQVVNTFSSFELELFTFILGISEKSGIPFQYPQEISNHKELVLTALEEYSQKDDSKDRNHELTRVKEKTDNDLSVSS